MTHTTNRRLPAARPMALTRRALLRTTCLAGAGLALGAFGRAAGAQEGAPDLILRNGRIHTMDGSGTVADAVAIRGGRIQAVGEVAEAGPGTRVVDLDGRTVVPGLIEPHIHVVSLYNRPGYHTILENTRNLAEIQEALRQRRQDVPEGGWITSMGGFHPNQWSDVDVLPTLAELDAAVPDRPVFLYTRFTGPAATNSMGKALFDEWDENPPLPHSDLAPVAVGDDGLIASGGFGTATPATSALYHLRSLQTMEDRLRTTRETQRYAASVGLTSMSDKVLFPTPGPLHPQQVLSNLDHYRMYDPLLELDRRGETINRVEVNFLHHQGHIEALGDIENQLPELRDRLTNQWPDFGSEMVWIGGIGEWAAPVNVDLSTPGGAVWREAQRLVAEAGWRNENAVSTLEELDGVLTAWEELAQNPEYAIADRRYIIHHADAVSADLLARAEALNVGIAMAAFRWVASDDPTQTAGVPFRDIVDSGVKAGLQGDGVHIAPLNPWAHIHYVVTGLNSLGQQVNDGQQLTREEALGLFTRENAWFLTRGDDLGTIEPGMKADLVVLDRDYFSVPDEELPLIRADLTVVGGEIVHER